MANEIVVSGRAGGSGWSYPWVSVIRFNTEHADFSLATPQGSIQIPSSGYQYSYERWCYIRQNELDSGWQVNNMKVWRENTSPSGVDLYVKTTNTYSTPVIPTSTSGFSQLTSTPISIPGTLTTPKNSTGGTGDMSHYFVLMLRVGPSQSQNPGPYEYESFDIKVSWDEVTV